MSHVVDVRNSMQKSEQPEPGHVFEALNITRRFGGVQTADIKQDNVRMGQESVRNLVGLINGEEVPAFTPIDGVLITRDTETRA